MSLSQVQIIRSLGEALAWFEKELAWGVQPAQLGHLTGRIGELYAAMITRGQMALATNQHGYDVVSADSERISVKTVTTSTHVSFRRSTIQHVDRVIVLRVNVDEGEASIEELLDCPIDRLHEAAPDTTGDLIYPTRTVRREPISLDHLLIAKQASSNSHRVIQYENGTIVVERDGQPVSPAKPILRELAGELGISLLNGAGSPRNTRQLGAEIIAALGAAEGRTVAGQLA
ncbi:hypothetical protein [uncultured Sphingomonas sp.]|uniref:DUF6998 domain-containing protein n=1 Tax=uncultured Sphingomonas sp. TaxID=158754 RepID=UPI0025E50839|nr:hypothetical protein [uncultured Sphingomonas sp.]